MRRKTRRERRNKKPNGKTSSHLYCFTLCLLALFVFSTKVQVRNPRFLLVPHSLEEFSACLPTHNSWVQKDDDDALNAKSFSAKMPLLYFFIKPCETLPTCFSPTCHPFFLHLSLFLLQHPSRHVDVKNFYSHFFGQW